MPSVAALGVAVLDHHRASACPSRPRCSIRKPRSAGTWSKTMSMTCCRTSSTGRTAISVSATLVRTFRMRLDFSIVLDVGGRPSCRPGRGALRRARCRRAACDSSPDAADDRARLFRERLGLVEDDLAFEALAEGELELAEEDPVAVLEGASTTGTPLTWVPFLDLRSTMRTPSSSTTSLACWREMPKSLRTIWQSGERPDG